jgi:hypothetical protein
MRPGRRTSGPVRLWTAFSGGCASWPSAWTGPRISSHAGKRLLCLVDVPVAH